MEDTPSTRRSTGERIGPWFVLQRKNPTAPGLRLSVLLTLARRGHVTPKSIVRGPTTGQFWRYAAQVKGLSRVFGLCWHCGASVSPDATTCPKCRSAQEIPDDPDQFLESHAALPVMREIPPQQFDAPEPEPRAERRLPNSRRELADNREPNDRRELADMRAPLGTRDLAARDSRSAPGTRSVTLARGEEDVILSASELAAAFQLDMPRQSLVRRTSRRLWKVTKVMVVLAVLVGGGAATAFYLKPEWYQQAKDYSQPYLVQGEALVAKISAKFQQTKKPAALEDLTNLPPITPIELTPTPKGTDAIANTDERAEQSPANEPAASSTASQSRAGLARTNPNPGTPSVVDSAAAVDALGGGTSVFVPTTKPVTPPPQVISDFPKIVDSILAKQDAAKTNEPASTRQPSPSQPAPSESTQAKQKSPGFDASTMTLEEAIATAATLRTSALDAEARKDWAAAVLIYEQIAKLPEGAHPSDLKVKLSVARDRAKS